jgi:Tol biopolymer transport system component
VFESSKSGKAQIFVMKTDGTGRRQLTQGDAPNTQPEVSPDGRKVIYASVRDRIYGIFEMNLDGTGERRLATNPRQEDSPVYAADGRSFYYLRDEGGNPLTKRVYRQDLVSGAASPITPVGLYVQGFSVSADGSTVALLTLTADANGVQTARVSLFNVATGAMTPMVLQGADRIAGPAFRPGTPQH